MLVCAHHHEVGDSPHVGEVLQRLLDSSEADNQVFGAVARHHAARKIKPSRRECFGSSVHCKFYTECKISWP